MLEPKPVLSVGMPVFNGERYLPEALDSILRQGFSDFDLVISDNASTDGTEEICRRYAANDRRIRYVRHQKNRGATCNYNWVFGEARGKYFKWASSNDVCGSAFFEKCIEVLEARPDVVLCYPRTQLFDSRTGKQEDYEDNLHLTMDDPCERFAAVVDRLALNNVMNGVIRADAMRETQLIPDIISGDSNFIAELALRGKFVELPDRLFHRRMEPGSATRSKTKQEVLLHFDPSGRKAMLYPFWKLLRGYFSGVRRAGLPGSTKLRLYRLLMVRARWWRTMLARDLGHGFLWQVRRVRGAKTPALVVPPPTEVLRAAGDPRKAPRTHHQSSR